MKRPESKSNELVVPTLVPRAAHHSVLPEKMKLCIKQLPAVMVLLLATASCGGRPAAPVTGILTHPGKGHDDQTVNLAQPDIVKKAGSYELRIYYVAKGTRSEGLHGVLTANGAVVDDSVAAKEMETDVGLLRCHGPWQNRKLLFASSGWLPKDTSATTPSWQRK